MNFDYAFSGIIHFISTVGLFRMIIQGRARDVKYPRSRYKTVGLCTWQTKYVVMIAVLTIIFHFHYLSACLC